MFGDLDLGSMGEQTFNIAAPEVRAKDVQVEAVADQNHFFDFETAKIQTLTLDQLKRTVKENDGESGRPLHGIYHFDLLDRLTEACLELGYQPEIYDMFATNNRDRLTPGVSLYPKLEERFGERAVEAHSIRRLYTNLRIRDFDTDELTTNLAVSYTQKGIQIGLGRNVKICHNQCMLCADYYVADFSMGDYRSERNTPEEMIAMVRGWLQDLRGIIRDSDEKIARMKNTVLTPAQVLLIIGMLSAARVQHDTDIDAIKVNNVYPLNQTQINKFTERLLVEQHEAGRITAWSMYNAATDLYKPHTAEQTLILPQNLSFVSFMQNNGVF